MSSPLTPPLAEHTANKPILHISFDVGDTLVHFPNGKARGNAVEVACEIWDAARPDELKVHWTRLTDEYEQQKASVGPDTGTIVQRTTEELISDALLGVGIPQEEITPEKLRQACDAVHAPEIGGAVVREHTVETLEYLRGRGYRMGIISNTRDTNKQLLVLERLGIHSFFDHIVLSSDTVHRKPDRRIFEHLRERWGVPAGHVCHIGDKPADVIGAQRSGMLSVLLRVEKKKSHKKRIQPDMDPDHEITTFESLAALIESVNHSLAVAQSGESDPPAAAAAVSG